MRRFKIIYILIAIALMPRNSVAQAALPDSADAAYKTIAAGPNYERSKFHNWLWGRNRRAEWATPIQVPILWLDTTHGGLKPYQAGGGNETRSLRLKDVDGNEYTLRSVNKSRKEVVPPEFDDTFIEDIIQDQVSMAHPYAALAIQHMQRQAGIYYGRSMLVWLPEQPALDSFNKKFKNDLYLFEQRPDGDWSESDNLGNFEKFESTEDLVKKMLEKNKHTPDQYQYIKSRLFDMLISDWDRHEDNWRWGVKKSEEETYFSPIARDRDNAFYTRNGFLQGLLISAAKLKYMQNFGHEAKNMDDLNWEMRYIDRFFTNALSLEDWTRAATELQQSLTDAVIAQSVQQLPPEIFAVSGKEIIEKLKSRREQLPQLAKEYYLFVAPEVFIPGSEENEFFDVKELDGGKTEVSVYRIDDKGKQEDKPYYHRVFNPSETKQIRIFGGKGHDEYNVKETSKIKVDVNDTTPAYKYKWYEYSYKGIGPDISYSNEDRLYVGLKYKSTKQAWDKKPFAYEHTFGVRYSISQNAISAYGRALYPNAIGKWDLGIYAEYDAIRWTNFYGAGNETQMVTKDIQFHRLRSREWFANMGLSRFFGKKHRVELSAFYQNVKNIDDSGRYVSKVYHFINPEVYEENPYAGLQAGYSFSSLNDSIVPVKGVYFVTTGTFANNFRQNEFFQKYEANLRVFIPVTKHISFAIRGGGATVVNNEVLNSGQLYQHAVIGGGRSLRGYRRERFWGQTAYYNQNELRFITDFKSKIMNGKIGIFGFFDNGRVWMPGENSEKIHIGYGPGILLAPFNKISATLTYSISEEIRMIQVRVDSKF